MIKYRSTKVMQETRRHIVEWMRIRGGQTAQDLVAALGLTRTAVISHLGVLQADASSRAAFGAANGGRT